MKDNVIARKSFQFSLSIIEVCKVLRENKEYDLAKQLLRSSTSIGANIRESSAAHSKNDFISKLSIASQEARESQYWLDLLESSSVLDIDWKGYQMEILEIIKILNSILLTLKEKY